MVVVLGPGSPELGSALARLGLGPLEDESGDATLWVDRPAAPLAGQPGWVLSVAAVAESLGTTRFEVYDMVAHGELDLVDVGGKAMVLLASGLPSEDWWPAEEAGQGRLSL